MFPSLDLHPRIRHRSLGAIESATASICVMPPYVSAEHLGLLLEKQRQGVDVTLVCHDIYGLDASLATALFEQIASHDRTGSRIRRCQLGAALGVLALLACVGALDWLVAPVSFAFLSSSAGISSIASVFLLTALVLPFLWRLRTFSYSYAPTQDGCSPSRARCLTCLDRIFSSSTICNRLQESS